MSKSMIPEAALAQHIAILGKSGSGKTYTAKGAVEHLLSAGRRVCVVDPTGVWYGLRSSANGKKPAFPIVVFGGDNADVPLERNSGKAVAEMMGTSDLSAVLDTSLMTVSDRTQFFTDFAEALLRLNRDPLHLVIDECHNFLPQGKVPDPQAGKMLHAANNLVSMGRSRGLRIVLISQRPAKVHKDGLSQVETLIALRLVAPQDRRAVEDWIGEWAEPKQGAELLASLPSLPTGTGWIWAPELGVLRKATFPKISTYDSSKAPDGARGQVVLASIDLPGIQQRLATVAREAVENDPKRLRARIAELEKAKGKPDVDAIRRAEEAAYARGRADGAEAALKDCQARLRAFAGELGKPVVTSEPIRLEVTDAPGAARLISRGVKSGPNGVKLPPSDAAIPQGEKAILCALAQYPDGCTREQLTVLTGFKRSTRDAYIQRLRGKGYADVNGPKVLSTPAGVAALGADFEPLPTGAALQQYWLSRLPEGEAKILECLVASYPDAVDRDSISEVTGYKRSTRDAYIQRMRAKMIVEIEGRCLRASGILF